MKVGHRQALNSKSPYKHLYGLFYCLFVVVFLLVLMNNSSDDLLDATVILSALSPQNIAALGDLFVLASVDSTNQYLLQHAHELPSLSVCLAECQTAGRGRRGRQWQSPGGNICLSLLQHYAEPVTALAGLSIAVGIKLAQTLEQLSIPDIGLKWPNDLFWHNRKLGGILVESKVMPGQCSVVIGIGINYALPCSMPVGQPWVDLATIKPTITRNALIGKILNALIPMVTHFPQMGLQTDTLVWPKYNVYTGQSVRIQCHGTEICGIDIGIDNTGALLLLCDGEIKTFHAGEVSLRGG